MRCVTDAAADTGRSACAGNHMPARAVQPGESIPSGHVRAQSIFAPNPLAGFTFHPVTFFTRPVSRNASASTDRSYPSSFVTPATYSDGARDDGATAVLAGRHGAKGGALSGNRRAFPAPSPRTGSMVDGSPTPWGSGQAGGRVAAEVVPYCPCHPRPLRSRYAPLPCLAAPRLHIGSLFDFSHSPRGRRRATGPRVATATARAVPTEQRNARQTRLQ